VVVGGKGGGFHIEGGDLQHIRQGHTLETSDGHKLKPYPAPKNIKITSSAPAATRKASTPTIKAKTCSATTTFPARSFLPAKESAASYLVSGSELSQLLQLLTVIQVSVSNSIKTFS
jgi:hypothetical protein